MDAGGGLRKLQRGSSRNIGYLDYTEGTFKVEIPHHRTFHRVLPTVAAAEFPCS